MSFKKTLNKVLTSVQRAAYEQSFETSYSSAAAEQDLFLGRQTQPRAKTSVSNPQADLNAARDAVFAYSPASDYSAVSEGLSYLRGVSTANQNAFSGPQTSRFGGSAADAGIDLQSMSSSEGVRFVKTALGLNIVEQMGNDGLQNQANQYARSVFSSLQAGTFSPGRFFDQGKSISNGIYTNVTSNTFASSYGDAASSVSSFNQVRESQRRLFFLGGMPRLTVDQNRLRDIGRMPEMKFKFLFYCDVVLWNGSGYRLISVKSVTGSQAQFVQEEVNFYGLRSTVNKSVKYANTTLTLHDDADNQTLNLFSELMSLSTGAFGAQMEYKQRYLQDLAGTNEDSSYQSSSFLVPSVPTLEERNGIIKYIKTTQVYMQDANVVKDVYTYINPKIVSLTKSDFDMDGTAEVQNFVMEFSYDALNVETGVQENPSWRETRDSDFNSGMSTF